MGCDDVEIEMHSYSGSGFLLRVSCWLESRVPLLEIVSRALRPWDLLFLTFALEDLTDQVLVIWVFSFDWLDSSVAVLACSSLCAFDLDYCFFLCFLACLRFAHF